MTDAVRVAVDSGISASAAVAVLALGLRWRRRRNAEDDAAVASLCRRRPRSTVVQLGTMADLSRARTSSALVRLIRAGRVRSEGGHAGIDATVYLAVEGGQ